MNDIKKLLDRSEFPRSSAYDPDWMMDNQMGANAAWLMEWLTSGLSLEPAPILLRWAHNLPRFHAP